MLVSYGMFMGYGRESFNSCDRGKNRVNVDLLSGVDERYLS